ncbi:GAF domain-containing protein [Halorubrum sp. DTA98]|uniref:GAF domain-containing protein n=1 Tax=Halorubrum sp. DTA98 TaxID=3402163 RepID=UPI003AAB3746
MRSDPNSPDPDPEHAEPGDGDIDGSGPCERQLRADGSDTQCVLVVDDEPAAAELAATYLDRLLDGVETCIETEPDTALDRIRNDRIDCVVSDYDMPDRNGLELLDDVRTVACDLPFVLFTGKGSEEIASEAISAGVTDYLQKGAGRDQYEILANRVDNALRRRRVEERSRARSAAIGRYEAILSTLRDPVFTVDVDGRIAYVNDALCTLTGMSASALHGRDPSVLFDGAIPPGLEPLATGAGDDSAYVRSLADAQDAEVRVRAEHGDTVTCESRVGRVEGSDDAAACVLRDVSERALAEAELTDVNRKVTAIHEFATEVSTASTKPAVFEEVVAAAEDILEFDRCLTARRDGDYVYPEALSGSVTMAEVRRFEVGEGIAGRTVADGRTFVIDEVDRSPEADPVGDDIRSAISVPIGEHGLFQAVSGERAAFDGTDTEFAELLVSHASDAIERIETERDLRSERDRLAALFDGLPLPVARVLIDDDETRLDATNEAFEETFGYSATEHDYRQALDGMVPPDGRTVPSEAVDPDAGPVRLEVERETIGGVHEFVMNVIPTEYDGGQLVYSVYADIEEHKRIERTLRELHEATREMFHGGDRESVASVATRAAIDTLGFPSSGVRLYDPEEGVLQPTAISEEATAAIGERPAFDPSDGAIWDAYETDEIVLISDVSAADTAVGYGELDSLLVVPLGDHGVMPLGSREPNAFDDTDVQLARVLGANVTVALDRAERTEQLHEHDAALQRELERLEKFAGVVSHDLRNPLNVAIGRLELARDVVDDEAALEELDRIEDAHERMTRLIDDLLALARQGKTVDDPESVVLANVADRAWRTVETGTAELDPPDDDATIEADPERLRTLLENLFRNSVEHGSTSDPAAPGDGVEHDRPSVTVSVSELGAGDGFSVADDGAGFDIDPEQALEYGVSDRSDGTGFGLAIVREIADAHGWDVVVDDDDGARFEFRTS